MTNDGLFLSILALCTYSSKFICDLAVLHFHFELLDIVAVSTFSAAKSNAVATPEPTELGLPV